MSCRGRGSGTGKMMLESEAVGSGMLTKVSIFPCLPTEKHSFTALFPVTSGKDGFRKGTL